MSLGDRIAPRGCGCGGGVDVGVRLTRASPPARGSNWRCSPIRDMEVAAKPTPVAFVIRGGADATCPAPVERHVTLNEAERLMLGCQSRQQPTLLARNVKGVKGQPACAGCPACRGLASDHSDGRLRLERARQGWIEGDLDRTSNEEAADMLGRDFRRRAGLS